MNAKTESKDVSIRVRADYRRHLAAIGREWPVSQTAIVGAALVQFRKLSREQQAEALRAVAVQSKPRRELAAVS